MRRRHKQLQDTPLRDGEQEGTILGWFCVHIEHARLTRPVNATFRNLLVQEYLHLGRQSDCYVYSKRSAEGGHVYYFSPGAAQRFRHLIEFWNGIGISEPATLDGLERVLGDEPESDSADG
jgi:hypothetical protein